VRDLTVDQQVNNASPTRGSILGLVAACALLAAILLPAGLLIGWLVAWRFDGLVLQAALIAVGICWISGTIALAAAVVGGRLGMPLHGFLLGMFFRTGLPLAAGVALNRVAPLAESGIFTMILGVYLCALVVETLLSLYLVQPATRVRPAAS
jgi:hypothetical protein